MYMPDSTISPQISMIHYSQMESVLDRITNNFTKLIKKYCKPWSDKYKHRVGSIKWGINTCTTLTWHSHSSSRVVSQTDDSKALAKVFHRE